MDFLSFTSKFSLVLLNVLFVCRENVKQLTGKSWLYNLRNSFLLGGNYIALACITTTCFKIDIPDVCFTSHITAQINTVIMVLNYEKKEDILEGNLRSTNRGIAVNLWKITSFQKKMTTEF